MYIHIYLFIYTYYCARKHIINIPEYSVVSGLYVDIRIYAVILVVVCIDLSGEKERERDHSGPRWSLAPGARAGVSGLSPGRTGGAGPARSTNKGCFWKKGGTPKILQFL